MPLERGALSSRPFRLAGFVVALSTNEIMKSTTRNLSISLRILLCAVTLHALTLAGFAQTTNLVLALDGSSGSVTVPTAPDLQNPAEFTLEAWIYPQPGSQNNTIFINKSDNASGGTSRSYELQWVANADSAGPGSSLRLVVFLTNPGYWAFVDAPAASNEWVHVAGRFSSSQGVFQIFTNGILAKMTTDASGLPLTGASMRQTTLPVRFGRGDYAPYFYTHGYMDEVRIWNGARSAQEICGNMFCRLTGTETNLAGYWNFDNGTANDLTGHGHNGTFAGTAQAVPIVGNDAVHAGICGGQPYFVTDLGTLGGNSSGARAINAVGVVAGFAFTAYGNYHAVVFTNGVLRDLGTLGGTNSNAEDINQSGQVVGFSNPPGSGSQRAFSYNQTAMTDLGGGQSQAAQTALPMR